MFRRCGLACLLRVKVREELLAGLLAGECEELYTATDKTQKANGCSGGYRVGGSYDGMGWNKMDGDVSAAVRSRTGQQTAKDSPDIWGGMAQGFMCSATRFLSLRRERAQKI
jgi:hypothetical protein